MFDVWYGDIELTTLTLLFSVILLLPLQLLLCFKVRNLLVRLLPVLILAALALALVGEVLVSAGWDSAGYLFLVIYIGFMLLACGIGWGIWAAARAAGKKR